MTSLLALFLTSGAGRIEGPPDGGGGEPGGTIDPLANDPEARLYTPPTAAPYNAPVALSTPTYDGTGQAIHPKVLDFGVAGWKGWRYWMAHTPFTNGNDRTENPSILVSQNGYYWQVPPGAPDPLYPAPPVPGFGSDTHLEYDPATDELVIAFRQTLDRSRHTIHIARSANGVTWPAASTPLTLTYPDGDEQTISPALFRVGPNDWRLFGLSYGSKALDMWRAPAAEGPWSGPYKTVGLGISGPTWNWHLDVIYAEGVFRALVDRGPLHEGRADGYRASSSPDGLTWSTMSTDFMTLPADTSKWDGGQHYRACMLPDTAGEKFRIWYSAHDATTERNWGIGYTEVPRSSWPAPPPAPVAGSGSEYKTLALSHGPAVMWRLGADPLTTTTEPDASGNGRVGTWGGRYVRAASLTGEDGYSSRVDQARLYREFEAWMTPAAYTVRVVYRPETTFSRLTMMSLAGADGGWAFRTNGTQLQFIHLASNTIITGSGTIAQGTLYHLAASVAADGTVVLYRDGVQVGTGTIPTTPAPNTSRLAVGNMWNGTAWVDYARGYIEYADLCPTVLTAEQILASAQAV